MFTVETYAPPELRSARIAFNLLMSFSHMAVDPNSDKRILNKEFPNY